MKLAKSWDHPLSEWDRPAWHDQGLCSRPGVDPRLWDGPERGPVPNRRGELMAERARLCDGCPVARECAAEALACHPRGTVRAGVSMPQPWTRSLAENGRRLDVLELVADGVPVAVACGTAYMDARGYEDAAAELLAGADWPGAIPSSSEGA